MASLNKVILLGNLGQDPEIMHLQSGGKVANMSLATSESWKDRNTRERKERTEWHRIIVWNEGLIGVIEKHLAKSDQIMVEGQLETRTWEKEGQRHYSTEIVLRPPNCTLKIIKCKSWENNRVRGDDDHGDGAARRSGSAAKGGADDMDDEIPF